MQHVLRCLHRIEETKKEQMFVLTHFNYDDYLNNTDHNFIKHRLPVPAGLKTRKRDENIGCFDVLIIHRQHGLLVGVVKTVSDHDDERQLVTEVSEAILQLTKAVRLIQFLMSDHKEPPIKVRMTLIVSSAKHSSLSLALENHADVAQKLSKCFEAKEVPIQLCLCADQLTDPHLTTWWSSLNNASADDYVINDDQFECLIARFCGPATTSCLAIPKTPDSFQLPKTLDQAVSVIGDLFDRITLYPGMTDLIKEPRVFLSGPPDVCSKAPGRYLQEENSSVTSPKEKVVILNCNIESKQGILDLITKLKESTGGKPVFVLADDLEINVEKSKQTHKLFKHLLMELPDIHCWASSCSSENAPKDWRSEILTVPTSCSPTVLQEMKKQERFPGIALYSESKFPSTTEGMPVKNIFHQFSIYRHIDYNIGGEKILRFLYQTLRISGIADANSPTIETFAWEHQTRNRQPTALQYRDILMLFEDDITKFMPVVTAFKKSGIPVQVIDCKNQEDILNSNVVVAANAGFLCGIKRKVVAYVERIREPSHLTVRWNKLRSLTSCTSQLVLVSCNFKDIVDAVVTVVATTPLGD